MLNPDGVIIGNYRTSFAGKDLNRQFKLDNKILYPTIAGFKAFVMQSTKNIGSANIIAYFDLHGHSNRKNVFMYGPDFPSDNIFYYSSKLIPLLFE